MNDHQKNLGELTLANALEKYFPDIMRMCHLEELFDKGPDYLGYIRRPLGFKDSIGLYLFDESYLDNKKIIGLSNSKEGVGVLSSENGLMAPEGKRVSFEISYFSPFINAHKIFRGETISGGIKGLCNEYNQANPFYLSYDFDKKLGRDVMKEHFAAHKEKALEWILFMPERLQPV